MNVNYLLSGLFSVALHTFVVLPFILPQKNFSLESPLTVEVLWEKPSSSPLIVSRETMRKDSQKNKVKRQPGPVQSKACVKSRVSQEERPIKTAQVSSQNLPQKAKRKAHYPLPSYPWVCRKWGQEGSVSVTVLLDEEGRVKEVFLGKSSGFKRLDQAVVEGVKVWVFPEENSSKSLTIAFRLKNNPSINFN